MGCGVVWYGEMGGGIVRCGLCGVGVVVTI